MATKTLKTTIIMRNDTAENWSTKKPMRLLLPQTARPLPLRMQLMH